MPLDTAATVTICGSDHPKDPVVDAKVVVTPAELCKLPSIKPVYTLGVITSTEPGPDDNTTEEPVNAARLSGCGRPLDVTLASPIPFCNANAISNCWSEIAKAGLPILLMDPGCSKPLQPTALHAVTPKRLLS